MEERSSEEKCLPEPHWVPCWEGAKSLPRHPLQSKPGSSRLHTHVKMFKGGYPHPFGHGSKACTPVNIPIPTKITWVVRLPQNGTIGFDPQPFIVWTVRHEPQSTRFLVVTMSSTHNPSSGSSNYGWLWVKHRFTEGNPEKWKDGPPLYEYYFDPYPYGCGSELNRRANRRFWSMFPLTRFPFWNSGFLSHSHIGLAITPQPSQVGTEPTLRNESAGLPPSTHAAASPLGPICDFWLGQKWHGRTKSVRTT